MAPSFKQASALGVQADARVPVQSGAAQDIHWVRENIPCQTACPAGTDIPGYLEAVYHGRYDDAYRINLRDNVFPGILGRVCSRPCETACRHGRDGNGDAVAICFSKRAAADLRRQEPVLLPAHRPGTGRRVAVIGAGVAGLAAARDLVLAGHAVTLLERHATPGGMLIQGIPAFRLPRDLIVREIDQVIALGVTLRCGVEVGRDVALDDLLAQYDAVVMAAGTQRPHLPPVPGNDLPRVRHGLDFLLQVNEHGRRDIGRRVVVIGGGYTAMDCARTALRLGASQVAVYYRRARRDIVVLPGELEEFLQEGGTLHDACAPAAFLGGAAGAASVRFERTQGGAPDAHGRARPETVPGSAFDVEADEVILATGQFPDCGWIPPALAPFVVGRDGWLATGSRARTARARLFAAGDFALGASTLIEAIGHARACAREVDAFLMGTAADRPAVRVEPAFQSKTAGGRTTGRTAAMNAIPIHPMPVLPRADRGLSAEVETGYAEPDARAEASRCYLCHYKFEIIDALCVLCDECVNVKPVPGCIVEISSLHRDEDGRITGYDRVTPGQSDSLYYNRLWIDQDQCIRCGQCESVCPVNAITIQKVTMAGAGLPLRPAAQARGPQRET